MLEFDESIRMALLVLALCNNSGITQKELNKEDPAQSHEHKKRRKWLCWNRKTKENEEEVGMLTHEEGTPTWRPLERSPPLDGASIFTECTHFSSS